MQRPRIPILTLAVLPVLVFSCETRDGVDPGDAWVCPTEAQHFTAHGVTESTIPMRAVPDGSPPSAGHAMRVDEYVEIPLPPNHGEVTVAIVAGSADHYSVAVERSSRWVPVGEIFPRGDMPGLFRQPEIEVSVGDAERLSLYAREPGWLAQICVRVEDPSISPWIWLLLLIGLAYVVLRRIPRDSARRWAATMGRADLMMALTVGAAALVDPVVLGLLLPAWVALRARDQVTPAPPPEARFGNVERLSFGALLALAFLVYAASATQVVGGCDSWSYMSQAMRMRGVGLDMSQPHPGVYRALVPMCHALVDGEVRSIFPPGFPAMLASASLFDLEFLVNPVLGTTSVGLVYALLARRTGHWVALVTAALWATTPILVWGSVRLMSDLPSTTLLLASLYAVTRGRGAVAGLVAGLTCGVRPASVLYGLAVAPRIFKQRMARSFYAGMSLGGGLWIVFLLATLGPPWDSPYTGYSGVMLGPHPGYFTQVAFFLHTIARLHPLILCLAALALCHRVESGRTYLLLFAVFIVFYGFWTGLLYAWWETRFVLPSYAALHLLGGLGLGELIRHPRWERVRRGFLFKLVTVFAIGGSLVYQTLFARAGGLFDPTFERGYRTDSERVAELTDERSVVAGINFTGPIRLYGHRASFLAPDPSAPLLIDAAFDEPRPVYAVIEVSDRPLVEAQPAWEGRYELVVVEPLTMWAGLELRRVLPIVHGAVEPDRAAAVAELGVASSDRLSGDPARAVDGARPADGSELERRGHGHPRRPRGLARRSSP